MSQEIRQKVRQRIRENKDIWQRILLLQYTLTLLDRIGYYSASEREGVPGIWGHSYVNVYYDWIGSEPKKRVEMEGGIATTYFVLRSLRTFFDRIGQPIPSDIVSDIATFIKSRTDNEGAVGIIAIDPRGVKKIHANLRHSCFAYLIMSGIFPSKEQKGKQKSAMQRIARFILKKRSQSELVHEWIKESWPIGGLASYITAMNAIIENGHALGISEQHTQRTIASTNYLVELIATIKRQHLELMGLPLESRGNNNLEFYPFWHPIEGLPVLRIHSTLGCLQLVGKMLYKTESGSARIFEIIKAIRKELDEGKTEPRFAPDRPSSLSAAISMLAILLETWYEPNVKDLILIDGLLSFVEKKWSDPEIYQDYWSEFVVPLLELSDICDPLQDTIEEIEIYGRKIHKAITSDKDLNCESKIWVKDVYSTAKNVLSTAFGNF